LIAANENSLRRAFAARNTAIHFWQLQDLAYMVSAMKCCRLTKKPIEKMTKKELIRCLERVISCGATLSDQADQIQKDSKEQRELLESVTKRIAALSTEA
jgi:hypothetical protein